MTNPSEIFYVIRASLIQDSGQEIWRSAVIPGSFSLLQLHVVLQDLFGWRETGCSFHYFSLAASQKPGKIPGNETSHRRQDRTPEIIYQTIFLEECDGWVKQIGPGMYIEHTHPHNPTPVFTANHKALMVDDELTTRVLCEERLYQMHHVFSESTKLLYEFDHGLDVFPTLRVVLQYEQTISPTIEEYPADCHLFPIVLNGEGVLTTPFEKQETFQLSAVQRLLNNTHLEHREGCIKKCYLCHRFEYDCPKSSSQCAQYTAEACCAYCIYNPELQHEEPYDEIISSLAWEYGLNSLRSERARFLRALAGGDTSFKCDWVENDGRPCVFCFDGYPELK
ncbi:hypothetical protein K493DRAFT_301841 [Basidiobolus meristosporus CBS 931.73]|uniref:Plasmid pRiA4b Orf3-like domain-containing protein n=1 Tax=Basidiobolus meristosporus CBS 931.73 TaxID=1314790 RepID=A0A1Y1Y9W6_9FUNG|nr:hypothetical protein K493DRAFT_301841 [Basidiobolus meristosporus CBS 931.73]|eukprot:ORX94801.1 hypothetical protein K493DRAFT_301841 [Basidiobolus meristosporus CBS 931.73]